MCQHRRVIPRATSVEFGRRLARLAGRLLTGRDRATDHGRSADPDHSGYPGDFTGPATAIRLEYAPHADGRPDCGEIVWAWVPYEEDHRQGKDRPVLVIGHDGGWLLALMLTSTDHDHDTTVEVRRDHAGRVWMDIGTGPWDPRARPSEVRLDRILRLDPNSVRREGSALERGLFEQVAKALGRGW